MSRRRLEPDGGVTFRRVLRSCRANSKNGRKTKPGSLGSGLARAFGKAPEEWPDRKLVRSSA